MRRLSRILLMFFMILGCHHANVKKNGVFPDFIPYHYRITPYQFGYHKIAVIALARPDYQQDPEQVMQYLKQQKVSSIFGLDLNSRLISLAAQYKLNYFNLAIPDFTAPDISVYELIYQTILAEHLKDHKVAIHCRAGIGRTGVVLAALKLKELAQNPEFYTSRNNKQNFVWVSLSQHPIPVTPNVGKAIELIRALPGNENVIEVVAQIDSLHIYETYLRQKSLAKTP